MTDTNVILDQAQGLSNEQLRERIKMYENNVRQYKLELNRINH